jgi:uncharacterized protein (TIGR01777 family)
MSEKKRVVITGATGMIGRPLSQTLIARGYEVAVLSRNPETAAQKVPGAAAYYHWAPGQPGKWAGAVDDALAVISLAGEPLFKGRVSRARYEYANQTRILGVRGLVEAMRLAKNRPQVFLCGSSVGIYGFQGPDDAIVTEDTPPGSDYHALGNTAWEFEALPAVWMGIRTALLRTGIVWGRDDGMAYGQLDQFRRGWGSIPGEGLNWVPWIHIADEVGIILHLLEKSDLQGPFNLSAPQPVQYRNYTRFLGEIVGKPSDRHTPELMTRLFMGKIIADMVLHNRRMLPKRALDSGYRFKFPEAHAALFDLFPSTD